MSKKNRLICGILAVVMGCLTLQAKTIPELRAAAEKGDAEAQFELGLYYEFGICVADDKMTAEKLFRQAAEQGHRAARAMCCGEGYGVKKDAVKAITLFHQAAEAGDAWSQFWLGSFYGANNAPEKSLHWFRKAAEQGNSWGQVFLGMWYLGIGKNENAPEDPKRGFEWCRKSAEQGNVMGQLILGGCHAGGKGVPKDIEKAVYWLRKAAEQDCEPAKAALKKLGK